MATTRRRSNRSLRLGFCCLVAALSISACSKETEPLSLIWISIDTLRADHLQLHGYSRDTSPFLTELAERGSYFDWVVSPMPMTLPTHLTQFTGIHPVVHGIYYPGNYPGVRLSESVRTLPEVLSDAGYRTRAWVDGGKMDGDFGFASGFEEYRDKRTPLPKMLKLALKALDELKPDERFFFFIQTYAVHGPYEPPEPYRGRYAEAGVSEARDQMNRYDGAIRFVDDELRAFVGEIERRGLLDRAVLAITSDHGEGFREYGIDSVGHGGRNLHQNVTRVPWIVLHPSDRRGKIDRRVGLVDFANTTLGLVGVDERLPDGVDLLSADAPQNRPYVTWVGTRKNPDGAWSLYSGDGHHYLSSKQVPGPERNALFDIVSDPLEEGALDDPEKELEMAQTLAMLRRDLEATMDARQASVRDSHKREKKNEKRLLEELRALGYVGDDDQGAKGGR